MSNLKEPLLKHEFFPEDSQRNQDLKRVLDDLYQNSSFVDVEIETVIPSKESMQNGEKRFVNVSGTVRRYYRVGENIYYDELIKG